MMVSLVCFAGRLPFLYQESPRRSPQKARVVRFWGTGAPGGHPLLWRGRPRKARRVPVAKTVTPAFS